MIPAYQTLPLGAAKKDLPLVVLVHGGPNVRGFSWQWNADVQFLASRGYAVLQPEFRGSTGFGVRHFTAGWKQWGRDMQTDYTVCWSDTSEESKRYGMPLTIGDPVADADMLKAASPLQNVARIKAPLLMA